MMVSVHAFRPSFTLNATDGRLILSVDTADAGLRLSFQVSLEEAHELLQALQTGIQVLESQPQEVPF
jgi:hypothetical protein